MSARSLHVTCPRPANDSAGFACVTFLLVGCNVRPRKGLPRPAAEAVCTPSSFPSPPPSRSAAMYPNVCYPTVRPSVPIPSYSVWHKLALFLPSARGKGECVDLTPLTPPPLSPLFQLISHDTNDLVMTFPSVRPFDSYYAPFVVVDAAAAAVPLFFLMWSDFIISSLSTPFAVAIVVHFHLGEFLPTPSSTIPLWSLGAILPPSLCHSPQPFI